MHQQYQCDTKKTAYLIQLLSVALRGETRFLFEVPSLPASPLQSVIFSITECLCACSAVCRVGPKIIMRAIVALRLMPVADMPSSVSGRLESLDIRL